MSSRASTTPGLQKNADGSVDVYFGPRRRQARSRTGYQPARTESSRCCFGSTVRRSRSSTRRGCCRTSRKSTQGTRPVKTQIAFLTAVALARDSNNRTGADDDERHRPGHRRELHPCRNRFVLRRGGAERRQLRKVRAPPRALVDRRPNDYPDEPRHALLGGGDRPRCGTGDGHAAGRRASDSCRCRSISEDEYFADQSLGQAYAIREEQVGTRYVIAGVRTLVDPSDPKDVKKVHALQDAIKVEQPSGPGKFEPPKWDPVSQKKVRDALIVLGTTLTDTSRAFGTKDQVDPVQRLISARRRPGAAIPKKDAIYLNFHAMPRTTARRFTSSTSRTCRSMASGRSAFTTPTATTKRTTSTLIRSTTSPSKKSADGTVAIQFGGCDGKIPNCLPIMKGWNYTVRLYRPRAEILNGKWKFPEPQPVS